MRIGSESSSVKLPILSRAINDLAARTLTSDATIEGLPGRLSSARTGAVRHAAHRGKRKQVRVAFTRAHEAQPDGLAHQIFRLQGDQLHLVLENIAHSPWQQREAD